MIITIYCNEVASGKKGNLVTHSMDSGTKMRSIGNAIVESNDVTIQIAVDTIDNKSPFM